MDKLMLDLERLVPEALDLARIRCRVLRNVYFLQPVGRRMLALRTGISERVARSEIETLKDKGAVSVTPAGIVLTDYGLELLQEADAIIPFLEGLPSLARQIKEWLGLDGVMVVPGDSFYDPYAKKDLGRAAARCVRDLLEEDSVLAVTGGTTLAELARAMTADGRWKRVMVLPARGGLGEEMEEQANTIAARIARAIGGQYRLLHIPDSLEEETLKRLRENPGVAEVVTRLKQCDILVHGIGSALEMACRRGLSPAAVGVLEEKQAVGETLRYYFNVEGEIVYCLPGIGLELTDLPAIPRVVAVAGGSNKARAIKATLLHRKCGILVTDEGAARAILERGC